MLNRRQYDAAMSAIATLMFDDPEPESPEGRELNRLVGQVVEYEAFHFPMSDADRSRRRRRLVLCVLPWSVLLLAIVFLIAYIAALM